MLNIVTNQKFIRIIVKHNKMEEIKISEMEEIKIREYAERCYNEANCSYDGGNYMVHIDIVVKVIIMHSNIFKINRDYITTKFAGYTHDIIEDCHSSYNNIKDNCGSDVADVTLAVTDVPAENRLMRHLYTMPKTVKDYRAIILKMSDMYANAFYSKKCGSSMYNKYVEEYKYRKPIFKIALKWYTKYLNEDELNLFWDELDEIHLKYGE